MAHAPQRQPKLLLVALLPYFLCPQLVLEARRVGFAVEVVCAATQPVQLLRAPPVIHDLGLFGGLSLGPWGARARIVQAIERVQPDLVIPCDDQAARCLRAIGRTGNARLRALCERSLGPAQWYPLLDNRSAQTDLARELGVRTPRSVGLDDRSSLAPAAHAVGLPAFLKRDGTWAGEGVVKVSSDAELAAGWARLSKAHTFATALKRAPETGWRHALAQVRPASPAIQLQSLVAGRPANRAVVCKNGDVLGGISVLSVETTSETGPASVVREIDHQAMTETAVRLARHLKLNGLIGFDFVIGDDGDAFFLEINARPTPAALLATATSGDLIALLFEATFPGAEAARRDVIAAALIAFFPQELSRDRTSPYFQTAHHHVPADEPQLVAFALKHEASHASPSANRHLQQEQPLHT